MTCIENNKFDIHWESITGANSSLKYFYYIEFKQLNDDDTHSTAKWNHTLVQMVTLRLNNSVSLIL